MSESLQLHIQIQESESSKEIKEETLDAINTSQQILSRLKEPYGEKDPRYQNALIEHQELQDAIKKSVESENSITQNELSNIMGEFKDITNLESYSDWAARTLPNFFSSISEDIPNENQLMNKNIDDYSIQDAQEGVDYLFKNKSKYTDSLSGISFDSDNISEIHDRQDMQKYILKLQEIIETGNDKAGRIQKEVGENLGKIRERLVNKSDFSNKKFSQSLQEELNIQELEFNNTYALYRKGKIGIQQLESEAEDIRILNSIDDEYDAIVEGTSYFAKAGFETDISKLKEIHRKMNLIFLVSKAQNIYGTKTFKEQRDEVSKKILELEAQDSEVSFYDDTIGYGKYNETEVSNDIKTGNFKSINKYELYFYIKNINGNFNKSTAQKLLTGFPRKFVRYISNEFLKGGGIMSALLGEKNQKFLSYLENINNVLDLDTISDLNKATVGLDAIEKEDGKDKILKAANIDFQEKLLNAKEGELNDVLRDWKGVLIEKELKKLRPQFIEKYQGLDNSEELVQAISSIIKESVKSGLKGDALMADIIRKESQQIPELTDNYEKFKLCKADFKIIATSIFDVGTTISQSLSNISSETHTEQQIINTESILEEITKENNILEQRISLLDRTTDEQFATAIDMIAQGQDFDEVDTYLSSVNEAYEQLLKEQELQKQQEQSIIKLDAIDAKSSTDTSYTLPSQPVANGDTYSFTTGAGVQIDNISTQEYEQLGIETTTDDNGVVTTTIGNEVAMKNLIDFKEITTELHMDFVWNFKDELIFLAREMGDSLGIDNNDDNLMGKDELNKLFNFILTLIGEKGDPSSISGTYSKIIELNGSGILGGKRDTYTGYGVIGQKFMELGYIGEATISNENMNNIRNYENIIDNQTVA